MKVFVCLNPFDRTVTGGEIFFAEVLGYLRGRGDVELIYPSEADLRVLNRPEGCLGVNRYFVGRFRQLPPDTVILQSELYYYNFFMANPLTKALRPDLSLVAQICQIPDILLSRSRSTWMHRAMMFAFLRSSDAVAVLSQSLKEQMIGLGAVRDNTHVVYISAQRLKTSTARTCKEQTDRPLRIACVAHIRPRKGQKVLVEALHKLVGLPFEAVLAGATKDPKYEDEVNALIQEYGLDKQVKLAGMLEGDDLSKAYAETDIFVLPSFHEPYGIVVQEAMSFGIPIIASNVDGIAEQVRDGVEGRLVPPGDPNALAAALRHLLTEAELRQEMGRKARKRASELPTWDEVCRRFWEVLSGVKRKTSRATEREVCGG